MANCIVRQPNTTKYELDAATRRTLIEESSMRPAATISAARLAKVERQRAAFIATHGTDGTDGCTNIHP